MTCIWALTTFWRTGNEHYCVFWAGVSIGLVCEEGVDEEGGEAHSWELLVDAGALEEDLGAMQLTAAGTREGFTLLQLSTGMAGMSCWPLTPPALASSHPLSLC